MTKFTEGSMFRIFHSWFDRYFGDEEALILAILLGVSLLIIVTMGAILAPVIASLIIAFLMQGMVERLRTWGMSHIASVSIAFVVLVSGLAASVLVLMPIIWQQAVKLVSEIPRMLTEWNQLLLLLPQKYPMLISAEQVDELIKSASGELGGMGQQLLSFSLTSLPMLVAALIYIVLVPILVFFFLKDSKQLVQWCSAFLPVERPVMSRIWREMNEQIANYVRGKVIEIIVVGVASYVAFAILGLNYALLLALAVGLSVVIPYIGAAVVTLPVAMIGVFQWGFGSEFFYLLMIYGIIQALDGNVLVPLLFSEAVNLHPVAIILAVLVFGGFWGFWGVFFAIPLATLVKAILNAWPIRAKVLQAEPCEA